MELSTIAKLKTECVNILAAKFFLLTIKIKLNNKKVIINKLVL